MEFLVLLGSIAAIAISFIIWVFVAFIFVCFTLSIYTFIKMGEVYDKNNWRE